MTINALRPRSASGDWRFLNYAATAPMLPTAAAAMTEIAGQGTRPMGEHFTAWLARVESARRRIADTVGARGDEITFTTNTSTALSLVAAALRWKPGDRVLHPADEFPSNRYVWDNLRDFGVRVEPIAPQRGVGFAEQLAGRDLSRVRVVALSAVSYRDGRRLDVEAVCRLCRERSILTAIDAIQAVGAIAVDARGWGCDFLACGGQKWLLGPVGSGFLYVARERLAELHVPTVGWASSRHAGDHEVATLEWTEGAARFEAGLPDVAVIAGLAASLEALAAAGWPEVFAGVANHRAPLADALAARGIDCLHDGLPGAHAGIVTFPVAEENASAFADALHRRRVVVTRRRTSVRVSAHALTHDDEIAALIEAVDEVLVSRTGGGAARREPTATQGEGTGTAVAATAGPPARAGGPGGWKHALVTGASRGLGAALAAELAARGCRLTLLARDTVSLAEVATELRTRHGAEVEAVTLDLSDAAAVAAWIAGSSERLATVDLLINNAARADAATFAEAEAAAERAAFETNLFAALALARAVLPAMTARGAGTLLNIATGGARNALPLFSAYAASKAALWAWSEALGRELDGSGVTVTTFVPPHMDTTTRRQLGRRALGYYDLGGAADTEGHRPGQADRLGGVARRALAAAAAGRALDLPRRARWEIVMNAAAPGRMSTQVRKRWKGARPRRDP